MEEENKNKNVVNHFEKDSNCQVFNGDIRDCIFAMPGSQVSQQAAPQSPVGNNIENVVPGNNRERNEERFHFIHPEIGDEEAWHIHDTIKRLVVNYRMPDICAFLKDKNQDRKLLLPSNSSFVYLELVRMGMPTGEGFSEKNFSNNYVR